MSLTVATLNLNGLRSATQKGLLDWLARESPHVALLQEVRADPQPEVFAALGYHSAWAPAQRSGYSGVAILSRAAPDEVEIGLGPAEYDAEGRVLLARFGEVQVASVYVPSGSSGEVRQAFKEAFLARFADWAREKMARGTLLLGGDLNVAHREIDLKNWRQNQKNSGFLPRERAWMTDFLALGLSDAHRQSLGERAEYTWWSNRGGAFANDVGWRLDYLLSFGLTLANVRAHKDARLSDHAPVTAELAGPSGALEMLY